MTGSPEGIVREARASDAEAIARVHVESSQDAYAPLAREWTALKLDACIANWQGWLQASESEAERVDLLVELEGNVVAFISAGPARREDIAADVEIRVIHVLPKHHGRGFGGRLWSAASERIRGEPLRAM